MRRPLLRPVLPQYRSPGRRVPANGARSLRASVERTEGGGGMKDVPVFQVAETELRRGTSLVEASAGTGKTFTIAGLFLRLILEKNLSVREILVVTYTVAATEELRHRIRHTLAKALQAFTAGASDDAALRAVLTREAAERVAFAVASAGAVSCIDAAPIY